MRITGIYFDLTDRFAAGPSAGRGKKGLNAPRQTGALAGKPGHENQRRTESRDKVLISVAKRLVASAVRRNTVKRVVREAWRAAVGAKAGSGRGTLQFNRHGAGSEQIEPRSETDVRDHARPALVCLMRLKRNPGFDARPGSGMVKKLLREDADKLFGAYLLAQSRRQAVRRAAATPAGVLPGAAQSR